MQEIGPRTVLRAMLPLRHHWVWDGNLGLRPVSLELADPSCTDVGRRVYRDGPHWQWNFWEITKS